MKTVLISGSNRGIGFEAARQLGKQDYHVLITARRDEDRKKAHRKLEQQDIKVNSYLLDVEEEASITKLLETVEQDITHLDILVNNAGVYLSGSTSKVEPPLIRKSLNINLIGPWLMIQNFLPLLKESDDPRIINVSSGSGATDSLIPSYSAYRVSKLGLNGMTQMFAKEFGSSIKINAMCPGWVRTRMGGGGAPRSVEQGADTITWLATTSSEISGKFFRNRKQINW